MSSTRAPAVSIAVKVCGECPFAWDGAEDDGWRCEAVDLGDQLREIRASDTGRRGIWKARPPSWCPLRKADRLVTLRLP